MILARRATALVALALHGCSGDASSDAAVPTADIAIAPPPSSTPRRPATKRCEPGETESCACPDDVAGIRTCSDDGTRMRACVCAPPKPPSETGIEACDDVLAFYDKLANDMEACTRGGTTMGEAAASIRSSRKAMLDAFKANTDLAALERLCTQLGEGRPQFECP